jgi:intein/homing endonuclease
MDVTIDNPQVTENNIAWLAGIIDGEGTISIAKSNRKSGKVNLTIKISIENTSTLIINEICKVFKSKGIKYYIYSRKPRTKKHKAAYVVNVCKLKDAIEFSNLLYEHLISKKEQAILVKKFAESRINTPKKYGCIKNPFTKEEIDICNKIQDLNKLGPTDTSTTLCKTLDEQLSQKKRWLIKEEKIKSGLHRDM